MADQNSSCTMDWGGKMFLALGWQDIFGRWHYKIFWGEVTKNFRDGMLSFLRGWGCKTFFRGGVAKNFWGGVAKYIFATPPQNILPPHPQNILGHSTPKFFWLPYPPKLLSPVTSQKQLPLHHKNFAIHLQKIVFASPSMAASTTTVCPWFSFSIYECPFFT